jgi:Zn-dependent protease
MSLPELLLDRAANFIPVLLSLTVHEWAHAWTAWRLGDDTAKMLGRVSLNPLDHIDPVGTLLLPLLGVPFGWAKPVPINPVRFRSSISMPMGVLWTAAAGPLSNLLLAVLGFAALYGLTIATTSDVAGMLDHRAAVAVYQFLTMFVIINVALAIFNLLPIPPLDGSRIVDALVPTSLRPLWTSFSALGPILLVAVILLPILFDASILTMPLVWVSELLTRITGAGV